MSREAIHMRMSPGLAKLMREASSFPAHELGATVPVQAAPRERSGRLRSRRDGKLHSVTIIARVEWKWSSVERRNFRKVVIRAKVDGLAVNRYVLLAWFGEPTL